MLALGTLAHGAVLAAIGEKKLRIGRLSPRSRAPDLHRQKLALQHAWPFRHGVLVHVSDSGAAPGLKGTGTDGVADFVADQSYHFVLARNTTVLALNTNTGRPLSSWTS